MQFEVDEPRTNRDVIYGRPSHEKGLLVVRTREYGNFVLDRLEVRVSESIADLVAAGEDVEDRIIAPDAGLSGLRHFIHGHGYVRIDSEKTGRTRTLLPVHDVLELEPAVSDQDAAAETSTEGGEMNAAELREHLGADDWLSRGQASPL